MNDHLTYHGAQYLAHVIEKFWAEKGETVVCRVERMQKQRMDNRNPDFVVRSDMVGGLPRKSWQTLQYKPTIPGSLTAASLNASATLTS